MSPLTEEMATVRSTPGKLSVEELWGVSHHYRNRREWQIPWNPARLF